MEIGEARRGSVYKDIMLPLDLMRHKCNRTAASSALEGRRSRNRVALRVILIFGRAVSAAELKIADWLLEGMVEFFVL